MKYFITTVLYNDSNNDKDELINSLHFSLKDAISEGKKFMEECIVNYCKKEDEDIECIYENCNKYFGINNEMNYNFKVLCINNCNDTLYNTLEVPENIKSQIVDKYNESNKLFDTLLDFSNIDISFDIIDNKCSCELLNIYGGYFELYLDDNLNEINAFKYKYKEGDVIEYNNGIYYLFDPVCKSIEDFVYNTNFELCKCYCAEGVLNNNYDYITYPNNVTDKTIRYAYNNKLINFVRHMEKILELSMNDENIVDDYKVNKLLYKYLIQEDNGVSLVLYAD